MKRVKYNAEFKNAIDWVKVHGCDFHNQFSEELWSAACKYVELTTGFFKISHKEAMNELNK